MSGKTKTAFFLLAALLILVIGGLALVKGFHTELAVTHPLKGPVVDAVYATAVVEPRRWSEVAPVRSGRIVEVMFNEGVRIDAGMALARMDDGDLRAQAAEAASSVEFRRSERERADRLLADKTISQQRHDEIRSGLEQALARQKMLEEQIRQMTVFAPINGMILWRDVEPGEVKQSGQTIFWIGEPKPLRLEAEIDEQDIPRIRKGQKVLITADAYQNQVMHGTIDSVTPKGDPVNKSYRVFVALPDDTPLMIGMTVETNTVVDYKAEAILVPVSALKDGVVWVAHAPPGQSRLYKARKVTVVPGAAEGEAVEIREGLSVEDLVIVDPPSWLKEDQEVSVRPVSVLSERKGGIASAVEGLAAMDLAPSTGAAMPGGAQQQVKSPCSSAVPQTIAPGDDKYTRMRKEWQSRGTCFTDAPSSNSQAEPAPTVVFPSGP